MKIMKGNNNPSCDLLHTVRNCIAFIAILMCLILIPAIADEETNTENTDEAVVEQAEEKSVEPNNTEDDKKTTEKEETKTDTEETSTNIKKEVITGTSDEMERDQKTGTTILIGKAKTLRHNEEGKVIGFLNADRITIKTDVDTGETKEIIAVGNVEIRDDKIFATCDHAVMDNLTNIITLKDNVEVLQNNDRLETKLFTFNRTTGKQTGVGDVKFKVTITQTVPEEGNEEGDGSDEDDGNKEGSDEKDKEDSDEEDGQKDGNEKDNGSEDEDENNEDDAGKEGSEDEDGSKEGSDEENENEEDDGSKNGSDEENKEEDGNKEGSDEEDKEGSDEEE
ncbi:hypothetical protein F4X73_02080 [Candidatus Poribacteria bacterium]|nr:hypothetical protein [Candidatus Poribacteria bacterium]